MGMSHFTEELFEFLADLEENNTREWFNENRDHYVAHVQEPALGFIADFAPRLHKISPNFRADARAQGGSLFRIHRDTRFSPDKTPYKTNTGLHFRHQHSKDAHAPGFYLHLQPGECFAGVGLWRPEARVAQQVREEVVADPEAWAEAAHGKAFTGSFRLSGDSLKRPPRGFDPEHRHIEDLRRKDYMGVVRLSDEEVTSDGFIDRYETLCRQASGFMGFLCRAVGLAF